MPDAARTRAHDHEPRVRPPTEQARPTHQLPARRESGAALRRQAAAVGYDEGRALLSPMAGGAGTPAITTFRGGVRVFGEPGRGARCRLDRGTEVSVREDGDGGWVEIEAQNGADRGCAGYVRESALLPEVRPDEYEPRFERVTVVLFQGAANDPNPTGHDVRGRRYFADIASSLAGARPNTLGADLASGNLIEGVPIEYDSGADIIEALRIVGEAVAAREVRPGVRGSIGEVHLVGHSGSGVFGATHELSEGLYTREGHAMKRALLAPFVARAPRSGVLGRIHHPLGAVLGSPGQLTLDTPPDERPLFDLRDETGAEAEPIAFPTDAWGFSARVVEVYRREGDSVVAGEPILRLRPFGAPTDRTRDTGDLAPIAQEFFAGDVKVCFHGCSTAAGEGSFAEETYATVKAALGAAARPVVYGRPEVGDTRSERVREYSHDHPRGSASRRAPLAFRRGLRR